MEPTSAPTRTLSTAEQRRTELIDAAVRVFAAQGYAAPTTEIAKEAGISQAYLFRLFPSKDELFAAAAEETSKRMRRAFEEAAAAAHASGAEPLEAMGVAYGDLLDRDRDLLLLQMHAQVASNHSERARKVMQNCFRDLYALVSSETGAPPEELRAWFAHGMLCNVMAAIDADRSDAQWAQVLAAKPGECEDEEEAG